MSEAAAADSESDRLLDVVVDILETEGYDAVQLREVARRARTVTGHDLQALSHPRRPDPRRTRYWSRDVATRIYPPRPPKRRSTKR